MLVPVGVRRTLQWLARNDRRMGDWLGWVVERIARDVPYADQEPDAWLGAIDAVFRSYPPRTVTAILRRIRDVYLTKGRP